MWARRANSAAWGCPICAQAHNTSMAHFLRRGWVAQDLLDKECSSRLAAKIGVVLRRSILISIVRRASERGLGKRLLASFGSRRSSLALPG
jgi:hypothetical protein